MNDAGQVKRQLIDAMAKHLPPSASTLRLLDVGGVVGDVLAERRRDLDVVVVTGSPETWALAENDFDAVAALDTVIDAEFLSAALKALRHGGRLILVDSSGMPDETHVRVLENAGYGRILVEAGVTSPHPLGVLMRGEKPHLTADTLARVRVAADKDAAALDAAAYTGRYIHLLIRQTPNKPAWALRDGETVTWEAVTIGQGDEGVLLAFSSLPKAVSFMQPAVLRGVIVGVTKVAKFSRETAAGWSHRLLLNPDVGALEGREVTFMPVDPASAETPDE